MEWLPAISGYEFAAGYCVEKCFLIYSEAIQKILFSDRSFK